MTKLLPALLLSKAQTKKTSWNIRHLKDLFAQLQGDRPGLPAVDALQSDGPGEMAKSESQEDAQNYLIRLMETLEKECQGEDLLS